MGLPEYVKVGVLAGIMFCGVLVMIAGPFAFGALMFCGGALLMLLT